MVVVLVRTQSPFFVPVALVGLLVVIVAVQVIVAMVIVVAMLVVVMAVVVAPDFMASQQILNLLVLVVN